jgi:hypothetical protein
MVFCLLLLLGGIAQGQQAPRSDEGPQARQDTGGQMPPQGGRGLGPPLEAFKACEGRPAGSTAQFTNPRGETVTGTCRSDGERLVLRPDRAPGNSRGDRVGPPPEAYRACEGKTAGSTAQFVDPRGETLKGTCGEENGRLVLRPDRGGAGDRSR